MTKVEARPGKANLVAPHKQVQVVVLKETACDVGPKLHPNATLAGAAPLRRLRIAPQNLAH